MDSYDLIQAFARKCATLPRLDRALFGAGIMNMEWKTNSSTGHEDMLLIRITTAPVLKNPADAPGRLVLVASGSALIAEFAGRNAVPLLPAFDSQNVRTLLLPRRDTTLL
ncbi:hypothetical protein GQ53DRAFT_857574, partial [Thozetella sp. PMI_491]